MTDAYLMKLVLFSMGFLAFGASATSVNANPSLKYLGFWQSEQYTPELFGWANLLFTESNTTMFPSWHAGGLNILFNVEWYFFDGSGPGGALALRADYQQWWATASQLATPLLANGTIFGFFLGDELIWNNLPYNDLVFASKTIKAAFPNATLYYNEAYPVFTQNINSQGHPANYTAVPASFDWVSIDFYPVEGTFQTAQNIYRTLLYPKMTATQMVLFVPPAYGTVTNPTQYCGNPDCATAMITWAQESLAWAQTDNRFVGLTPWHWHSYPANEVQGFEIGARDMPTVAQTWRSIGKQIIG